MTVIVIWFLVVAGVGAGWALSDLCGPAPVEEDSSGEKVPNWLCVAAGIFFWPTALGYGLVMWAEELHLRFKARRTA